MESVRGGKHMPYDITTSRTPPRHHCSPACSQSRPSSSSSSRRRSSRRLVLLAQWKILTVFALLCLSVCESDPLRCDGVVRSCQSSFPSV
ncbi:hypothetical protein E2C01_065454 [Portunus trituberculatus]|uniref:Uncharacterized protein n=1 Tax=Portunus trituberculatus TaxID=210409 RepID=A0A5B7HIW0_PORTR|nr:hypothetical protein [Portunus trituberculatus]